MERKKPKLERPINIQTTAAPPWIDLPTDLTANILHRIGAIDILENAQKVCTTWRRVCLDPAMWRVIDMKNQSHIYALPYDLEKMCRHAVDRSQGGLIDITIEDFGTNELIDYISERSSHLRRLSLACCLEISGFDEEDDERRDFSKAVKKFPELEELYLINMENLGGDLIETIGVSCPMLKSFSFNTRWLNLGKDNDTALAIAKYLPNLRHLGLVGNELGNEGLEAILDGCPHLESLDLRECFRFDLVGDLGKRCSRQIKCLKCPFDEYTDDYEWEPLGGWPNRQFFYDNHYAIDCVNWFNDDDDDDDCETSDDDDETSDEDSPTWCSKGLLNHPGRNQG